MRTKPSIRQPRLLTALREIYYQQKSGKTLDEIETSKVEARCHVSIGSKGQLSVIDFTKEPTMDDAIRYDAVLYGYRQDLKATRDERGAHRAPAQDGEPQPELKSMKDLVDETFGKNFGDLPEMVPVQDDATLPLMSDREMIAALTRHGYIVCKPVNTAAL